jgi:hypothetical protein
MEGSEAWSLLQEPATRSFKAPPWFVVCWSDFGLPEGQPGVVIPEEKLPGPVDPRSLARAQ